jgi:predicted ATPase
VVADRNNSEDEVIEQVITLVAKSLVTTEGGGVEPRFRLLETTRAYLLKKLAESGESSLIDQRHAACHRDAWRRRAKVLPILAPGRKR